MGMFFTYIVLYYADFKLFHIFQIIKDWDKIMHFVVLIMPLQYRDVKLQYYNNKSWPLSPIKIYFDLENGKDGKSGKSNALLLES